MAKSQLRSIRKKNTGGKYHSSRKKKLRELAGISNLVSIAIRRIKIKRTLGGNKKTTVLSSDFVNAYSQKDKKTIKLKILSIEKNLANKNYERSNIVTKGAVVKTDKGDVKITSRPGQTGSLNGILL